MPDLNLPDGLRAETLVPYLAEHLPAMGQLLGAELIAGGRSNLTYRLKLEGGPVVLRRPPLGHILPSAHDMRREYRFIESLAGSDVPIPAALAFCDDEAVIGAKFYLMEFCLGRIVRATWPEDYGSAAERPRTSSIIANTLTRIHAVDWRAAGLEDMARPGNYVERQLKRLGQQYELSTPEVHPAAMEVRRRLGRAIPPVQPQTIVHGDYAIHNVLLADDDPGRITAVLDWEMATIGDPLADLGWVMAAWAKGEGQPDGYAPKGTHAVTALPGFWTREAMVAEYGRASGRDVSNAEYYYVLGLFKMMVIWAGIDARYRAGVTRGEGFETYGPLVAYGAERALAAAGASSIPALRGVA